MFVRLFCMECGRAFGSIRLWFSVFLMVLMEILSSSMTITNMGFGVDEILDNLFSGTGSATLLLMMFPLIPYAVSYAKDMEERALDYYMVRADAASFVMVRFIVSILSAFFCVIISFLVFGIFLFLLGHPVTVNMVGGSTEGYQELLESNTLLYFLCYSSDRGLSAAMMAASAVFLSVVYPHSFFAFTSPICLYFLAERVIFPGDITKTWLMPDSWMEGVWDSPAGGVSTFLCKFGVACMVCMIYGILSVVLAKRRWHYA